MINFLRQIFKRTPECKHEWSESRLGQHTSQFFYGNDWERTCLHCSHKETGWSQYGRRWDESGKEIQIERIFWTNEITIVDR